MKLSLCRNLLPVLLLPLLLLISEAGAKPNVILIYADDLGAGLLGCYGQKLIKTPHIDKLASEGMRFSNAHGCMYCAPARASLLTGLHDAHKGAWAITRGGLIPRLDAGTIGQEEIDKSLAKAIPAKPNEIFLPQLFQKAGYKTAQFGKLDWGFLTTHARLKRHGWDHYLGYMDHARAHGFYPTYLWLDGEKLPLPGNTHHNAGKTKESYGPEQTKIRRDRTGKETYSQNVFIEHILKFIEENHDSPFFIYHSTQIPHGPVDIPEVHPDFVDHPELSDVEEEYASMVKMLDDHVGLIMSKLEELDLDEKTLVLFTSDNGHEVYYFVPKGPARKREYHGELDVFRGSMDLAGTKWSNWQGGIRTPLIARWPGKIAPNTTTPHLTAVYDYLPTFAELVGQSVPNGKDGISFLPALLGERQKKHDYIVIANALITDRWKYVVHKKTKYLFDLHNDPGERTNVASEYPEKFRELERLFEKEKGSPRRDL